ncbi:hypothetical protein F5144DRAFT_340159 [Chaetomium tenue]|uniref:Uncharacterized protein n=1 Tax=Chaetomium tenue TaxID=1854479 RepID=A0ACB7NYT5_9PEZI|nr:hypothetical protein F5144DRAFT_340159 [Chaetomium globosum]
MEPASNLQTPSLRRKNRAAASHLTLAPLTTLLPREEYDTTALSRPYTSYIQGRSAPTTPVILSHSPPPFRRPSRDHSVPYSPARAALTKSKSSIQLPKSSSSTTNTIDPNYASRSPSWRARPTKPSRSAAAAAARRRDSILPDTELLLHVGAVIASEARDAKGQGWLVTRANSTSSLPDRAELALTTPTENDLTPQARILHHRQQRWERERRAALSAQASRRGSRDYSASASASALPSTLVSPVQSHFSSGSRSRSRRPMTPAEIRRAELLASMEDDPQVAEDYFGEVAAAAESSEEQTPLAGAAFVNIDMEREFGYPTHDEDEILEADEEYIRKLTKQRGVLAWIVDKMMGREYEDDEEEEEEEDPEVEDYGEGSCSKSWEERKEERDARRAATLKSLQNSTVPLDERPPKEDGGLLSDAAWLFNVAKNSLLL